MVVTNAQFDRPDHVVPGILQLVPAGADIGQVGCAVGHQATTGVAVRFVDEEAMVLGGCDPGLPAVDAENGPQSAATEMPVVAPMNTHQCSIVHQLQCGSEHLEAESYRWRPGSALIR